MPTEEDRASWREMDRQRLVNTNTQEWEPPEAKEGDLTPITADQQGDAFNVVKKVGNFTKNRFVNLGKMYASNPTLSEHKRIKAMPEGEEKEKAAEKWFMDYYGKSRADLEKMNAAQKFAQGFGHDWRTQQIGWDNPSGIPAAMGKGLLDFGMDMVGLLPGGERLDNAWDKYTKYEDPALRNISKAAGVIIPSMYGGNAVTGGLLKTQAPRLTKALAGLGAYSAVDAAIVSISDTSEEDDNIATTLAKTWPGVFGPKGSTPLPDFLLIRDDDSPAVRKRKNTYEAANLSIVGSLLGFGIKMGKPAMSWFKGLDDTAKAFKNKEIAKHANPEKLIELAKVNEALSSGVATGKSKKVLINRKAELTKALEEGDLEDYVRYTEESIERQATKAGVDDVLENPESITFNKDVTPVSKPKTRQSIPSGNVARNMADVAANKRGTSAGDNAPILSSSMIKKGLRSSRNAVMAIVDKVKKAGNFQATVDGIRFSQTEMSEQAHNVYKSIIDANSVDEVKNLFINKQNWQQITDTYGKGYVTDYQFQGIGEALKELNDRYLGLSVTESSARVMDTAGREIATITEAMTDLADHVDVMDAKELVMDKMQVLMEEYALNKYIWGWSGQNKQWWKRLTPGSAQEETADILKRFKDAENTIHKRAVGLRKTIENLAEESPLQAKALMDAFSYSKGDVDDIAKLAIFAQEQVSPLGIFKTPGENPKEMNLFAKNLWGVRYNNVLSGLSPLRAAVGNGSMLMLKPINAVIGAAGPAILKGDLEQFRKVSYMYGGMLETNRRAVIDAWHMIKRAHKNPDDMMAAFRKDFVVKEDEKWGILDALADSGKMDDGTALQYNLTKGLHNFQKAPFARYGMTGMAGVDSYTNTYIATYVSRARAYDDVFTKYGKVTPDLLAEAEKKHYAKMFDNKGFLTDDAAKAFSGEIALNLDDGVTSAVNGWAAKYPIIKEVMMFPRASMNWMKLGLSYTPLATIPGMSKYGDVLWASTDEQIAKALKTHGIDMAKTPNAKAIFQNLKSEYQGRLGFSTMLFGSLQGYALSGNIRGNGHYRADRRIKEMKQMGYEPKTIKIGDKWVSYKGIPGVDQLLTLMGDFAYYTRDMDSPFREDLGRKIMWSITATFLNETPLTGLEPVISILNNDLAGFERLKANAIRSSIPFSSGLGVVSDAITSSQKDMNNDMINYVKNRIPGLSSTLPEQIDAWTGQPLNDIDNPWLRVLNAVNPIKVSGTSEPWRQWLLDTGYSGLSRLTKHSSGHYEYTPEEREWILRKFASYEPYKDLEELMKSKRYRHEAGMIRAHRLSGDSYQHAKLNLAATPVHKDINDIVTRYQRLAEDAFLLENPHIDKVIRHNEMAKVYEEQGRYNDMRSEREKAQTIINDLVNMRK